MLTFGTKSLLGLSAAAVLASFVYGVATSEGSGTTLLAFTAAGAFALAVLIAAAGPDRAPVVAEGLHPQNAPAGGRPLFPSVWPLGAALAVGAMAVGAATGIAVIVPAIAAGVVVLLGWVFQAWTEHPIFTARFGARLSDRLLVPLGLPVAVFLLVATIAISLSRILLAVPKNGSAVVAIVVALVILASAFFIASQERMAKAALSLLSAFALIAVVAAGAVGFAHGERTFEKKAATAAGPLAPTVYISAKDTVSFNIDQLAFPAGRVVPLFFDNETPGVAHNIGIYDRQGGTELFKGEIVTGPKQTTYHVPPLGAGTYYFQCDVHNNMHGTLTVGAGSGAAPAAPAGSTASTSTTAATSTTSPSVGAGFATTPATAATGTSTP